MTVCRWRLAGLLPRPIYATEAVTLWREEDIDQWEDDGKPMANGDVADRQIADRGLHAVNVMCRPESPTSDESLPAVRHRLDRLESSLNRCSLLVQQTDDPVVSDRFDKLRAAVAAAAEGQRDA